MASHTNSTKRVKKSVQLQIGRNSDMEPCTEPVNLESSDVDDEETSDNILDVTCLFNACVFVSL